MKLVNSEQTEKFEEGAAQVPSQGAVADRGPDQAVASRRRLIAANELNDEE